MSEETLTMPRGRAASAPLPATPLRNALILARRSVALSTRNFDAMLTAILLPVMIMLLIVYLFGGAIQTPEARYVDYVVPGVLLLCSGFVSALTAVSVTQDLKAGIVDRFRSMDVSGGSFLASHVAASLVRCACAIAMLLITAFLIGFRPAAGALDWLFALGMLLLFVTAISWLAAVFGLLARTPEGASGFSFFIMFLPYASSTFVPIETMPSWIQGFATLQPATPVIESLRALLLGMPIGWNAVIAAAWCLGLTVLSIVLAGVLFRRRTA